MARGEEAKARRKAERKEARQKNAENLFDNVTTEDDNEEEIEDSSEEEVIPRKKKSGKRPPNGGEAVGGKKQVIKPLPLILLILLTGTTVLPALIYMSDWVGKAMQKNHVMGSLGYKLGIGSSPRKRVLSFYEKHDPEKISEVPNILAKYYGDYPKLIKRLERKYQDYGYFLNWEQDEAPMVLAMEKLQLTYEYLGQKWQIYAPQFAKTALRNMRYNLGFLTRKGKKIWRKTLWPVLEPYFGVPKGGAAQKRKDAQAARSAKKKSKRYDYRDEDEF